MNKNHDSFVDLVALHKERVINNTSLKIGNVPGAIQKKRVLRQKIAKIRQEMLVAAKQEKSRAAVGSSIEEVR